MYLLLGNTFDPCCLQVEAALRARGCATHIVDSLFSETSVLSWRFAKPPDAASYGQIQLPGSSTIPSDEIEGILVRDTTWRDTQGWSESDTVYMSTEIQAALLGWLWSLDVPVVNRLPAWLWYRPHPPFTYWLSLLQRAGLRTPETLISNDSQSLKLWRSRHPDGAIYSPLTTSDHFLLATDADWEGINALAQHAPVSLSEPHAQTHLACVVGRRVLWNGDPPSTAAQLSTHLLRFADLAGFNFVQLTLAAHMPSPPALAIPHLAVIAVSSFVQLHLFDPVTQRLIAEAVADILTDPRSEYLHTTPESLHRNIDVGERLPS